MVGTMHDRMAAQTCTPGDLSTGGRIGQRVQTINSSYIAALQIGAAIELRTVITAMALLAQPRSTRLEQGSIGRAVRRMTVAAIIDHRAVFPEEGTAFFGMAGIAGFIQGILDQQLRPR